MAATTTAFEAELIAGGYTMAERGEMAGMAYRLRMAYLSGAVDPAAHALAKAHPKQVKTANDKAKMTSFDAITAP